jgi:hypothetical protein
VAGKRCDGGRRDDEFAQERFDILHFDFGDLHFALPQLGPAKKSKCKMQNAKCEAVLGGRFPMGLLAPLYLAGLAALSLPFVLHLIRRTPRGRQAFSSLMFLTPSPPRLTRRSRLDHVLLLILRLTALALLALAFARPFLRESAMLPLDNLARRRVAILLDTSASMRRGDLWQKAVAKVEGVLKDLGPKDDVALFTFDDRLRPVVELAQDAGEPATGKPDLVRERLRTLSSSWRSTDLAGAMIGLAGELESTPDEQQFSVEPQLVLITDLARGSRTGALEGYTWPETVPVVVHALAVKQPSNASAQLLSEDEEPATGEPRVRITNAADSTRDEFSIGWQRALTKGLQQKDEESLSTYVPAGQSRVIRLPRPTDASFDRIVLRGDEAEFDNTFYVAPPIGQHVKVAWIGNEAADDTASPRYYFELAVADDPLRKVDIEAPGVAEPLPLDASNRPHLIVTTSAIPANQSAGLRNYVSGGGTLLTLMHDIPNATALSVLLDDVATVESSASKEGGGTPPARGYPASATSDKRPYSLFGEIDFTHPLFAVFSNPRYSDFTKIHFWRHQAVTIQEPAATRVVARFDNGDPAILERSIGSGRVLAFTSGWQPDESQLALSSKFVPLIHAIIDMACGGPVRSANVVVGQDLPLPSPSASLPIAIEKPDGTRISVAAGTKTFDGTDQPGIYHLTLGSDVYPFAVNIASAESNTAPMDLERLEQLGVRFASQLTRAERVARLRQQRDTELESHQRLWRWLIVATIGLLIFETWLAGRAARRMDVELSPVG